MNIKQLNDSAVELTANGNTVVFAYDKSGIPKPQDNQWIVAPVDEDGVVFGPGEYEFSGIGIIALETKSESEGIADAFAIKIDEVNVLFTVQDKPKLKKEQWDLVGEVNVIVANMANDSEMKEIVAKAEPGIVLAINSNSDQETAKRTDLNVAGTEKKLKVNESDFSIEEAGSQLIILTK